MDTCGHLIYKLNAMLKTLGRRFFARDAAAVARDLLGAVVVHDIVTAKKPGVHPYARRARIVETEAYVGAHDLACHAAKGRTRRTEIMFGPGGFAYVYLIYGMYAMLNVVTGAPNDAQAVLIRAATPLDDWDADLTGPGKLARAMEITVAMNGTDLCGNTLYIQLDSTYHARPITTPRIGVDYAQQWTDAMLRYVDQNSPLAPKLLRGHKPARE